MSDERSGPPRVKKVRKKKSRTKRVGPKKPRELPQIGWREWVGLPELDIEWVKVKVDTGARSSTLHAVDVRHFERDGVPWVRFDVHPYQRDFRTTAHCEAPLLDERIVRSSVGHTQRRPVIEAVIRCGAREWPIELTLTNRDAMGFRMLLGRQAMRNHFLVDPGRSYVAGPRPPLEVRRMHRAAGSKTKQRRSSP